MPYKQESEYLIPSSKEGRSFQGYLILNCYRNTQQLREILKNAKLNDILVSYIFHESDMWNIL